MTSVQELGALAIERGGIISGYTCPKCAGGRTRERSLSVWPHASLPGFAVAKCWRNQCGYSEDIVVQVIAGQPQKLARSVPPAATPLMRHLTTAAKEFMLARYKLPASVLDYWRVRQHPTTSALYLPVMSRMREQRGYVLRKFGKHTGPKAESIVTDPDAVWQAWFAHPTLTQVVLVEDIISALRLWRLQYTAVALLGTSLSPAKLEEVQRIAGKQPIVVALDGDATAKAIAWTRAKHANLKPVRLWRDIKDSSDHEIQTVLADV